MVGLGLHDELDVSLRAVEELRGCAPLFVEQYTSRWAPGALDRLRALVGHAPEELDREAVEGERRVLEALARSSKVAFLVVGEPFAATTHIALRLAAERAGHGWRVLHNASILTAAASLVGLSHYTFGRTVSLPRPRPGFRPTSPYEGLLANWRGGLQTLVILDLDTATGTYITGQDALRALGEIEAERQGGAIPPERRVVIVERAGAPDARVTVGRRERLEQLRLGPPLHCVIVPGPKLHFVEEEALAAWGGPPA